MVSIRIIIRSCMEIGKKEASIADLWVAISSIVRN